MRGIPETILPRIAVPLIENPCIVCLEAERIPGRVICEGCDQWIELTKKVRKGK